MKLYEGNGILNSAINKLPFELHIPGGYNFCGPGTKLKQRLDRGDKGINLLDESCKRHDIAYSKNKDINQRHAADRLLADEALQRFKSKDATIGERIAALSVAGAMKTKVKLGMGVSNKNDQKQRNRTCLNRLKKAKITCDNLQNHLDNCISLLENKTAPTNNIIPKKWQSKKQVTKKISPSSIALENTFANDLNNEMQKKMDVDVVTAVNNDNSTVRRKMNLKRKNTDAEYENYKKIKIDKKRKRSHNDDDDDDDDVNEELDRIKRRTINLPD